MGREATRREVSYVEAGLETFKLHQSLAYETGTSQEESLIAAIESAVNTAQRAITRGTRDDILEKAEDLDNDEGEDAGSIVYDGAAALMWYAYLLDETLPPEQRLDNQ